MEQPLKLTRLAGSCNDLNSCPAVDLSDRGTFVLTGPGISQAAGLRVGPGEHAIELSIDLVREAIRAFDTR